VTLSKTYLCLLLKIFQIRILNTLKILVLFIKKIYYNITECLITYCSYFMFSFIFILLPQELLKKNKKKTKHKNTSQISSCTRYTKTLNNALNQKYLFYTKTFILFNYIETFKNNFFYIYVHILYFIF